MKRKLLFSNMLLLALFLLLAPVALPSTTLFVNGGTGSDSHNCLSPTTPCKTIGHAISLATSGDTIMVAASTYTENLSIGISLSLVGAGAATTIVDGGGVNRVVRVFNSSAQVTLSKLTIRHGKFKIGGGIYNSGKLTINNTILTGNEAFIDCASNLCPTSGGGGVFNDGGTLAINNSTLTGNSATMFCPEQCHNQGGGIFNNGGTLTIYNSTLSTNFASAGCPFRQFCSGDGGGIFNFGGALTISGSTINGNSANAGGGIDNNSGTLTINNSTFSGNSANFNHGNAFGGGIVSGGATISNSTFSGNSAQGSLGSFGGGIYGNATLQNSIVANSPSGGNCSGTATSKGHNLSSDGTCKFSGTGDLNNHDPLLGPLQNNGGPTETMALLPGSPAIDGGNPSGCTDSQGHLLKTDQRGMPRPDREDLVGCDVGAYERQSD